MHVEDIIRICAYSRRRRRRRFRIGEASQHHENRIVLTPLCAYAVIRFKKITGGGGSDPRVVYDIQAAFLKPWVATDFRTRIRVAVLKRLRTIGVHSVTTRYTTVPSAGGRRSFSANGSVTSSRKYPFIFNGLTPLFPFPRTAADSTSHSRWKRRRETKPPVPMNIATTRFALRHLSGYDRVNRVRRTHK